jgi:hypothetical protein
MPRQELWAAVNVRRLVNFILLEPPAHAARWHVAPVARIEPVVQLLDSIAQHDALRRIHLRNVAPDSISECHYEILPRYYVLRSRIHDFSCDPK